MESGQENSPAETELTEPLEWWGPDLTPPTLGDQMYRPYGTQTFEVSSFTWEYSRSRSRLRCEPTNMPSDYYKIIEREVVQDFMSDSFKYYITVEWDLDLDT